MGNKTAGVYRIFNKATGRNYVGSSSTDWRNRRNGHRFLLKNGRHPSTKMQEDWDKYGAESFKFLCVCECEGPGVLDMEEIAAKEFKAFDKELGYNTKPINGTRFRGGRPGNSIPRVRFSKMVTAEQASQICAMLEVPEDRLVFLHHGDTRMIKGYGRTIGECGDSNIMATCDRLLETREAPNLSGSGISQSQLDKVKQDRDNMGKEVDRLVLENENLQSRIGELQAGLTDPYIRGLRALVSKQQLEIARLS